MQKRVVGNINELNEASRKTASEKSANTAGTDRGGCKANKTSFGRFKKFAVIIMLLIVSVFCAIGSADWIISQQEQLPGGSGSTFVYDKKTLQNYIALKGSDETEAAAKVAKAEEYASLQTETDSDDSAVADKFIVKKAAVSKKSAVSTYANGLESAIYGKSAIYNGKPIVAIKKTAGIDNAAADLPDDVLNGSLLTSYKPLTDGSVTEADLTEADFAEGATSGLPQNAGTYAILVKIKRLEAYGYAVKIFTILPCPVTVGWSGVDFANGFTYDGAAHPVTAAAKIASSDNGNIEGSEVNANLSVSIAKDGVSVSEVKTAGDYTLTAASGNDNYYISSGETTSFTVSKREATAAITLSQIEIDFGSEVPTATIKYSGVISGDTLGAPKISFVGESGEYKKGSDVGTYTIGITGGLDNENYSITTFSASFTVTPYRLTIEWSDTDLKYTGKEQKPKATISNPIAGLAAPAVTVTTYISGNDTPISTSAVGKYIAKASITDGNYSIASGGTTKFTISRIQVAIPTSGDNGDNMLEYTGSKLTYKLSGFDESTMTITGDTGSSITEYAYKAVVSLKDSTTYEWSDKTTDPKTFAWYIVPTLVKFDGILEKTYEEAKTGITLGANVFTNLVFKNGEKANTQATGAASTIKVTDGNGNDYTGTSSNNVIKVGSTYKAEIKLVTDYCFDIQVDETANKCTFNRSGTTYIKYKTAKIGNSYYTIEDALAQSGNITIVGDSTNDTSHIITAFSKLGLDSSVDSAFSDYKSNYAYTLNGKLIVSFDGQNSTEVSYNKGTYSKGFVNSAFIIPSGVNLTLSSSSNLIIGAAVAFNQQVSTTVSMNRGVIMNDGQITAQSGSNIASYGYIKGAGNIIMQNGSKAVDALAIYDWPGGTAASSMYKNVFPSNSYTMHNISCKTVIYAGAIYSAKVYVYMSKSLPIIGLQEREVNVEQIIIGTQSDEEKGMFNLTNNSDKGKTDTYIIKSVTTYNGEINSSITSTNQRIMEGNNQYLNHRDKIEIFGNYSDDSLNITVNGIAGINATLENNTSKPLPVGFMDVSICRGTMNLTKSDYLILPGATIKVENGGTLKLGSNVDIIAMPYNSMPTGGRDYLKYYTSTTDGSGKEDGKLIINGTLTGSGYNLGGKILTESADSTLTVVNASGSYVTMISYSDPYYQSGTLNATGNIVTGATTYNESTLSAGTYYSTNVGTSSNPVYAWFKDTATITYVPNGGTLNGSTGNYSDTVSLPAGGYTQMPSPTKTYYTFEGWYFDKDLTEKATAVFTDCTLYAKWSPVEYTVIYNFDKAEYGTLPSESLLGNEIKVLSNPPIEQVTINGDIYKFIGWYLKPDFTGESVSSVNAKNANDSKIINVYAYYTKADDTYRIDFNTNPENITFANNKTVITLESRDAQKGIVTNIESLVSLLSIYNYNSDSDFDYYFSGWYLSTDDTETILNELPDTITTNIILYAKWEKKNILTINFASNDLKLQNNKNLDELVKYYHNESINLNDIYSTASIDKKIDNIYPPHNGNVKEYLLSSWIEDNNTLSSEIIDMTKDRTVTAYHKRCYYIVVQLQNENIKGVTSGTGIYYVSSSENNYSLSITCTTTTNERYTPIYSAENASIDTNGVLSFTNSNSAQDIVISISTKHWYTVISSYSDFKITKESGEQDGNWFTEGSKIKISISARINLFGSNKKASINKNGKQVATLEQAYLSSKEHEISALDGYYTITKIA